MPAAAQRNFECPRCGYNEAHHDAPPPASLYRPWHLRGQSSVKDYVESLGAETCEWLLALYVDNELNLLAVDTVARGDIGNCPVSISRILWRGHELKASAFVLVHNHPSGDPTPSRDDIKVTARLRRTSEDMELPLLAHFVLSGDEMRSVGEF